jgi:hypothetical protein
MQYKVVFTGKIAEGHIPEKVKKDISEYFKLDHAEVEKLFSGKPITVKNNTDTHKCQHIGYPILMQKSAKTSVTH